MSASVRENPPENNPDPTDDRDIQRISAEMQAIAEEADAEAVRAEALAAAARARALQLHRRAELAEDVEGGDSDAASDTASDTAPPKRAWYIGWTRRPRSSTVAATLAVVVILASLATSVYMVVEHRHASEQQRRAAEFTAAARQGVLTLTSLNFKDARHDVQRIIDASTGSFRDDFQKGADDFATIVEQSQVVEQATVRATAVDLGTMTRDSAVVLVASESEVTNAAGAKQDPRRFRLIVTVARDGHDLKMSKVQFVP